MPRTEDHLRQARHNEDFYQAVNKDTYSDWAMTAIFYAALHYIDAFLARMGMIDPGGHDARDPVVQTQPQLRPLWPAYRRLKDRSRNARYYCVRFPLAEVERAYQDDLAAIRNRLVPLAK